MKFGSIFYFDTGNIGDDIQSYAAMKLMPQCDYYIDREGLDAFRSDEGEPVATLLNGWYLNSHYNWPPSPFIYSKVVGFHLDTYYTRVEGRNCLDNGVLLGAGAQFLSANSPLGCRDYHTLKLLQTAGFDAYFSGCLTLTLTPFKAIKKEDYICLVDVPADVCKKIQENSDSSIRVMTHALKMWELPIPERIKKVEQYLKIYQGAKCVVTTRLHCALPCLALNIPVLFLYQDDMKDRIETYLSFLNYVNLDEEFSLEEKYNWNNPPENPQKYLKIRESLYQECADYVNMCSQLDNFIDPVKLFQKMYQHIDMLKGMRWKEHLNLDTALEQMEKIKCNLQDEHEKINHYEILINFVKDLSQQIFNEKEKVFTICNDLYFLQHEFQKQKKEILDLAAQNIELKHIIDELSGDILKLQLQLSKIGNSNAYKLLSYFKKH